MRQTIIYRDECALARIFSLADRFIFIGIYGGGRIFCLAIVDECRQWSRFRQQNQRRIVNADDDLRNFRTRHRDGIDIDADGHLADDFR